nr:MAG TPA: hypothetical protein [Caudoviricetes sp.]
MWRLYRMVADSPKYPCYHFFVVLSVPTTWIYHP